MHNLTLTNTLSIYVQGTWHRIIDGHSFYFNLTDDEINRVHNAAHLADLNGDLIQTGYTFSTYKNKHVGKLVDIDNRLRLARSSAIFMHVISRYDAVRPQQ
jgi:hypothetical protein